MHPHAYCGLTLRRYPRLGTARLINCFKDFLVPGSEFKIGKTFFTSPDRLNHVMHLKYLDIKITKAATGEIKAKEGRILGNLRATINRREAAVALFLASNAAAQVNGASLSIDGGWTAR